MLTHTERLPDGRYNLVLRGIERFRIIEEDHALSYRRAVVEPLREQPLDAADRTAMLRQRSKLESMLVPSQSSAGDPRMPASMSDEDLVNALAQYLDLEPLEKQALLEKAVPAHPRRVARRAARDEDPDGADARPLERRALTRHVSRKTAEKQDAAEKRLLCDLRPSSCPTRPC